MRSASRSTCLTACQLLANQLDGADAGVGADLPFVAAPNGPADREFRALGTTRLVRELPRAYRAFRWHNSLVEDPYGLNQASALLV